MKGEDFLKELNNLEADIIEEAREPIIRKKKKVNGNIIKFATLAACITIFTGAVIVRSIGVQQKKNIQPAGENTSEGSELGTEDKISDIEEKKQIIWLDYDVNQDGIKDKITIDIPAEYESRMAGCTITDGSSENIIYQTAFSSAYPDWSELYLCEREGFVYFIEYRPILYQGIGNYHYEFFLLNNIGEKTVINENDMFFNLSDTEGYAENIPKMAQFYYEINDYLSDSMLLISTVNNNIQYSEENNKILKQEEYKFLYEYDFQYTQTNMYEKLNEYFLYLNEQIQYAEKHISLVVEENTLTPSGASFQIINTSGMDGYSGEVYYIEELEDKWEICDYVSDSVSFQDMKWPIATGEAYSFTVDWSNVYGKLENGSYRLVKKVSLSENVAIEAVCYFNIPKDTNSETIHHIETVTEKNKQ